MKISAQQLSSLVREAVNSDAIEDGDALDAELGDDFGSYPLQNVSEALEAAIAAVDFVGDTLRDGNSLPADAQLDRYVYRYLNVAPHFREKLEELKSFIDQKLA